MPQQPSTISPLLQDPGWIGFDEVGAPVACSRVTRLDFLEEATHGLSWRSNLRLGLEGFNPFLAIRGRWLGDRRQQLGD